MSDTELVSSILRRLDGLEEWQAALNIERAREDENRKHTDAQFADLKTQLLDIKTSINKAVTAFIAFILVSFGTAFVAFVINGGLHP